VNLEGDEEQRFNVKYNKIRKVLMEELKKSSGEKE
jgi:hypothetical protein